MKKVTDAKSIKKYLTPKQVEKIYGLTEKWLANMRWQKRGIPYLKVGSKVLYRLEDIEDFIEKHAIRVFKD